VQTADVWRPSEDKGLKSVVDGLSKQLQWIIELQADIKKNTDVKQTMEAKEVNANASAFQQAFERWWGSRREAE